MRIKKLRFDLGIPRLFAANRLLEPVRAKDADGASSLLFCGQARRLTRSVQESKSTLNSSNKRRDRVSAISPDSARSCLNFSCAADAKPGSWPCQPKAPFLISRIAPARSCPSSADHKPQFLVLSTSAPFLIHGIMSRSFSPTSSIGWAASLARVALNEVWLTLFSSIQSRANLPDWMSSSTRFISALVSEVTMRGPVTYSPYSAVLEIE